MTPELSKDQERRLSEQYSRANKAAQDETEARVFQAYDMIGNALRSRKVSHFDAASLANRMAREMNSRHGRVRGWLPRFDLTSALTAACAVYLVLALCNLWPLLRTPGKAPVSAVEFTDDSSGNPKTASSLWKYRLQHSSLVTVPKRINAELRLSDGSIVSCSPETRIAICTSKERRIRLNTGSILVEATHIPNSTMSVETPYGDVGVVGTNFWVQVKR
ncbi:MAG: FecR family protein [bacterium]